jgi:hypothetical protein
MGGRKVGGREGRGVTGRIKILLIGGYGVFGSKLVEILKDDPRLKIVIAGRSRARAKTLCIIQTAAELVPAEFDRDGDVEAQIGWLNPDIVIDMSGPFQSYGEDPYKVVRGALAAGAHYLDLADSRSFVAGITEFEDAARVSGKFVLSGLSTYPALSGAVVRHLAEGMSSVDRIACGIAPSPHTGFSRSVIDAVLSYAGRQVRIVRNGKHVTAPGLVDSRDYTITQPGKVPLFTRRFSLVDVPDLELLPPKWPQAGEVWTSVGTEPRWALKLLNGLAELVANRVLPSIRFLGAPITWFVNQVHFGENRGGMFVRLYGRDAAGQLCRRRWHLIAEGGDGQFVPVLAAAAVISSCLTEAPPQPGARTAEGELSLPDFSPFFERLGISTMVLSDVPEDLGRPVYMRVLEHAYRNMAPPLQALHNVTSLSRFKGRGRVERGKNPLSWLVAGILGFPRAGQDVPVEVDLAVRDRVETWTRRFDSKSFRSTQEYGSGRYEGLVVERFGPMAFGLALVVEDGNLYLLMRRWDIFGIAMPKWLAPRIIALEHAARDRFNFSVKLSMPLIGLIVAYRGWLEPVDQTNP